MGKDADMLQNAGIIIEEPGFLRQWSGFHNLEFLYTIRNKLNKKYMYSVLEKVGLEPRSKIPVGKYSLGMRQRLAIGQAIMEQKGGGNTIEYFVNTTFNYPTMAEAYRVAALNGLNRLF